jgi:hypothetical protein
MQIKFNAEKIKDFTKMLDDHSFNEFRGFTSRYRGFEVPNLNEDVKMKILHKLSASNYLQIPSFKDFWVWFKKNHGMTLVGQMCEHLFPAPEDMRDRQKMINVVRNNRSHAFWMHIKARIYKKWCSIVTEAQCVYATLQGVMKNNLDWKVFASAELDAIGIDFVIANEFEVVPIQIKKDSFSFYAKHKKNGSENLMRFDLTKKAERILKREMEKNKVDMPIASGMLLKYGLMESGRLPYEYLSQYENGFVYFRGEKLVAMLNQEFNISKTID